MPLSQTTASPVADYRSTGTTLNGLDWVALVLMIVGGVNWGLVGLFGVDLVATLFGPMSTLSRAVYVLVGLAALYGIVLAVKCARKT
ncbi:MULTISPECIES: DUF378 domain-containing protein [unclassified Rhizobacter]|uniref:DUF378 domain-containing protein n=1 Tax=unclassified Rhizobacter TaxID=2640088 RepID=UPI0006FCF53E|nr:MULTISPECIES: DUF378 domain-containing protein [unclassified Rhizobacter]KQU65971.1 hypothetical protein ASC88_10305 [Rhizobacter sp. Root29]KQV97888.1 hypothetical protein ASC98_11345 [Rhizobacter sp. Root1238]KRB18725.1 hypothetical protein ASE08_05705 [Rhizobacter sp. Root16D2]